MINIIQNIIDDCREVGLRRTKALEQLISTLVESSRP
ncbi:MAG: hypothetical protein RIR37_718, partial [Verrucomicrobiota bacterium]